MLLVRFQLGPHRYALAAQHIVEIIPLLALSPLPPAPRGVAGTFIYHGHALAALDLCSLTLDRPALEHLSTRILIIRHQPPVAARREPSPARESPPDFYAASDQLIGLIAERVTGTFRQDEKDFVAAGLEPATSPFLGPTLLDAQGVIQLLDPQKLFTARGPQPSFTHELEIKDALH